jgi:hypothetical protein
MDLTDVSMEDTALQQQRPLWNYQDFVDPETGMFKAGEYFIQALTTNAPTNLFNSRLIFLIVDHSWMFSRVFHPFYHFE